MTTTGMVVLTEVADLAVVLVGLIVMAAETGSEGMVDMAEAELVELMLSTWEDFRFQQMSMMFWK